MRKIASILLLVVLLFNWFGYRLLVGYWQDRAKSELEARLDVDDYDESQLISVKLPATHLAYYNSSPKFERVDGSVEINGVQYKFVKRRLYNDSLEWLCLPDQGAMKLRACANGAFRLTTGLTRNFSFDPYVVTEAFITRVPFVLITRGYTDASFSIPLIATGADEPPPDELA